MEKQRKRSLDTAKDPESAQRLISLHRDLGTWTAVSQHLGVNVGLCHMVASGKRYSPTVRRALGLPHHLITITLENVDDVEIEPSALAHIVKRFKLAPCPVCARKFYRIGNTQHCHEHSWASGWHRTREAREWKRSQQVVVQGSEYPRQDNP